MMTGNKTLLLKRVLISFWVLEWLVEIGVIASCSIVFFHPWLGSTPAAFSWGNFWFDDGQFAAGTMLTCMSVFMLLRIGPVVLFVKSRLNPLKNLAFELPQVLIWPIVWIYNLSKVEAYLESETLPVFVLAGLLSGLYIGSFLYSCLILYRSRVSKSETVAMTIRPESFVRTSHESLLYQDERSLREHDFESILPSYEEVQETSLPTYVSMPRNKISRKPLKDDVKVGYGYD